jgi:hypothetical protein
MSVQSFFALLNMSAVLDTGAWGDCIRARKEVDVDG